MLEDLRIAVNITWLTMHSIIVKKTRTNLCHGFVTPNLPNVDSRLLTFMWVKVTNSCFHASEIIKMHYLQYLQSLRFFLTILISVFIYIYFNFCARIKKKIAIRMSHSKRGIIIIILHTKSLLLQNNYRRRLCTEWRSNEKTLTKIVNKFHRN